MFCGFPFCHTTPTTTNKKKNKNHYQATECHFDQDNYYDSDSNSNNSSSSSSDDEYDNDNDDHYQSFVSIEKDLLKKQKRQEERRQHQQEREATATKKVGVGGVGVDVADDYSGSNNKSRDICSSSYVHRNRRGRLRIIGTGGSTTTNSNETYVQSSTTIGTSIAGMGSCSSRSRHPLCCPSFESHSSKASRRSRTKKQAGAFNDHEVRPSSSMSSSIINTLRNHGTNTGNTTSSTSSSVAKTKIIGRSSWYNNNSTSNVHGGKSGTTATSASASTSKEGFMKDKMKHHEERIKQLKHACQWRSAIDPSTGRTYYYHLETRETTWDKPIELATGSEREERIKELQRQKEWFAQMEENVKRSLLNGKLPGNVETFNPNEPIKTRDWALKRTTSSTSQHSAALEHYSDEEHQNSEDDDDDDDEDDDYDESIRCGDGEVLVYHDERRAATTTCTASRNSKVQDTAEKTSEMEGSYDAMKTSNRLEGQSPARRTVNATRTSSTSDSSEDGDDAVNTLKENRNEEDCYGISTGTLPSLASTTAFYESSASSSGALSLPYHDDTTSAVARNIAAAAGTKHLQQDAVVDSDLEPCSSSATTSQVISSSTTEKLIDGTSTKGPSSISTGQRSTRRRGTRRSKTTSGSTSRSSTSSNSNMKKHIRTISSMDDTLLVQLTSTNNRYSSVIGSNMGRNNNNRDRNTTCMNNNVNDDDNDDEDMDRLWRDAMAKEQVVGGSALIRRLSKQRAATPTLETIFSGEEHHNGWATTQVTTPMGDAANNEEQGMNRSLTPSNVQDIFRSSEITDEVPTTITSTEDVEVSPQRVSTDVSSETIKTFGIKDNSNTVDEHQYVCGSFSLDDDDDDIHEDDELVLSKDLSKFSSTANGSANSTTAALESSTSNNKDECILVCPKAMRAACSVLCTKTSTSMSTAVPPQQEQLLVSDGVTSTIKVPKAIKPKLRHSRSRTVTNGASLEPLHTASATMTSPDNDKTITCICGVYRAHILESSTIDAKYLNMDIFNDEISVMCTSKTKKSNDVNGRPNSCPELMQVEDDEDEQEGPSFVKLSRSDNVVMKTDYQHDDKNNLKSGHQLHNETVLISSSTTQSKVIPVPTLDEIIDFMKHVFLKGKLESECLITTLIYIERIMLHSRGHIRPHPTNWKSMLLGAMLLSSKVLDDLSMWNIDFSKIMKSSIKSSTTTNNNNDNEAATSFPVSLERINTLEIRMLGCVGYHVKVSVSEYGKYYFLLRSMWIRNEQYNKNYRTSSTPNTNKNNGRYQNDQANNSILFEEAAKLLEQSSAKYERTLLATTTTTTTSASQSNHLQSSLSLFHNNPSGSTTTTTNANSSNGTTSSNNDNDLSPNTKRRTKSLNEHDLRRASIYLQQMKNNNLLLFAH